MKQNDDRIHTIRACYGSASVIATIKNYPYMAVFFPANERTDKCIEHAMGDFRDNYGHEIRGPLMDMNAFKGFWLPSHCMYTTGEKFMTSESAYLLEQAHKGHVVFVQDAKDINDLNKQLPGALKRSIAGIEGRN